VGSQPHGGIDRHLETLRFAVIEWLEWEAFPTKDAGERDMHYMTYPSHIEQDPEQPEPYTNLRRLRRFNFSHLTFSGGLYNQPYLEQMELHTVVEAEYEYTELQALRAKKKAANANG
jgi:hypothetical protein